MSRSFREVVEDEGLELISPNSTSIQRLPALRRLGDVDNDGLSDFAFISEGFTGDNAFQIVLGSTADTGDHTFDSISDDHSFVATVTLPDSFKLSDFASAGDLNGDGLTDLQFFAVNEGVDGSPPSSRLFVVFNDAEGFSASIDASQLDGTNGFEISDGVSGRAQVADFNGDGFDDLALETSLESGGEDRVDILFGAEAGFAGTVSLQSPPEGRAISVASPPQDASIRVAKSSGDINGDGFDDLILVGANPDINTSRSVFVVFGGAGLSGANIDLSDDASDQFADIPELRTGSSFGSSVAVLEDMNGDGIADFAISAPRSSIGNRSLAGEVFVIFGGDRAFQDLASLAELDGENGFRITGADFFDNAGSALDAVGDYNGDGLSDLLVGAGRAEGLGGATEQGELYLIFGSEAPFSAVLNPDNLNGENGRRFTNADADRDLGAAVASIGDHNGDGLDDFVVGSARDAGGSNEFKIVSVLFGRETFAPDAAASSFSATEEVATELNFFANSGFGADQGDFALKPLFA